MVLERRTVASTWRNERWDSLRLLTPNWMTRLPGFRYDGPDPDGYMTAREVEAFLLAYGRASAAPVIENVAVQDIAPSANHIRIRTTEGNIDARRVLLATGAASTPRVPTIAEQLPSHIHQVTPIHYRNPDQIGPGRVLVVGASASGAQIADELGRAGRDVTICVGDHVRLPRQYRGRDIHWWLDKTGVLDERYDEVPDLRRARRLPSLQLVGTPNKRTLDLNALMASGVSIVGRLAGISGDQFQFAGSLANYCRSADLKLGRLLDAIDEHVQETALAASVDAPTRFAPTRIDETPLTASMADFGTVVWATGFRPHYPWLPDELLDHKGAIIHDGGVMGTSGLYVLGLPFLRKRKSSFLDGVAGDAAFLVDHLHRSFDQRPATLLTTCA